MELKNKVFARKIENEHFFSNLMRKQKYSEKKIDIKFLEIIIRFMFINIDN